MVGKYLIGATENVTHRKLSIMQAASSKSSTVEECHEYWKKAATIIRKEIKLLNLDPYQLLSENSH